MMVTISESVVCVCQVYGVFLLCSLVVIKGSPYSCGVGHGTA